MSRVVLVDWLGRGGIAQTAEEWVTAMRAAGHDVTVVTRPGRDLAGVAAPEVGGRLRAHRAVAHHAAAVIDEVRPDLVVVQNYVIPTIERSVYAAAAKAHARVAVVVHDHRLHSLAAGTRAGLRAALRRADTVVAHTHFVGDAVTSWTGRSVDVIPHPIVHAVIDAVAPAPFADDGRHVALHFGVLKRGYKGTDTVREIAARQPDGWRVELLGANGYVGNGTLAAAVRASDATLLPYRMATQSGAVVLAQALGSVAVASAVGGIPEQIEDGVTGVLVPAGATTEAWVATLARLTDDTARADITARACTRVEADHAAFVAAVEKLARG